MQKLEVGIPVECQNGHKAIYWYRLDDLDFVDIGVLKEENCQCPKAELDEGWARIDGEIIIKE